jgi:uncharacterized membrane protein
MERDRTYALLGGMVVGAAAMYFLDPNLGRRRRALAGAQVAEAVLAADAAVRRLVNTAAPQVDEDPLKLFLEGRVPDARLADRVRSTLRGVSSYPRAIRVTVLEGVVTLEGFVLDRDVTDVVLGVRRVPGIVRLDSRMEAVPTMPQGFATGGETADLSPGALALARAAAGAVSVSLVSHRALVGLGVALAAGFTLARARGWRSRLRLGSEAATIQHSVEVEAPIARVFAFWSSFRNLAGVFEGLREVREGHHGISHWTAVADGETLEWDVEVTALKPHSRIAWKSLEGSAVRIAGEAEFEEMGAHRTRVTVTLTGDVPSEERLERGLERLRLLLEEGAERLVG